MVIVFKHNGEEFVSAAPRQWLREKENGLYSMWPKSTSIERKAIKLCMDPEEDWLTYKVEVVGYFATLKEALAREISKQNSSNESEVTGRDKGKRKIIKKKYRDDSISPAPKIYEEESNDVTIMPSSNTSCENLESQNQKELPSARNIDSADIVTLTSDDVASLSSCQSVCQSESQNQKELPSARNIDSADIVTLTSDDVASLSSCQSVCQSGNIVTDMKEIKSFITYIMRKVEAIELSLKRINVPSEPKPTLLPKFPLTQINQITALEDMLGDENVRTELFEMLRHTGGSKERDCVNRCLEKIFSDYLGQYCSWTGKKSNFKLAPLTLMTVIKRAVRQTFPNVTDESFQRDVMNWFQHASTRLKRR